ncbi:MAG: MBL fold metallo-hydrolase [Spirochaetia bacterium]
MPIEEIRTIASGKVNAYVVRSEGKIILVDTGMKGKYKKAERALASMGSDCTDIDLVILTHTHYDHSGNAAECKKTSGASIVVHAAEAENLRSGISLIPSGATSLGKIAVGLAKALGFGKVKFPSVEPDTVFGASAQEAGFADGEIPSFDLHSYGFPGIALHTPSHSPGSLSLISDEGSCFPGDILFNIFPGTVMPPVADKPELLAAHWRLLLNRGARRFYPGHGKPFDKDRLEKELESL